MDDAKSHEDAIRAQWEEGAFEAALTTTLEAYGAEVYSFLVARLRDEDTAGDVFSQTTEDLWVSLERFKWQCSMRTWIYKLARSAAVRYERTPANRRNLRGKTFRFSRVAEQIRSRTARHLRTEIKDRFTLLREELPADDQTLLVLRVNRGLSWAEVARVMEDDELTEDELKKVSARLRQRFQSVKNKLRERAQEEGLLDQS